MKVVVTRPLRQARPLVERLEGLGHAVVACPLVEIEPVGPRRVEVSSYDWVVVTSANGAEQLARRRHGRLRRVAAIGPATAAALASFGIRADLVSRISTQEGLVAELPRPAGRVLFAGAEGARRYLVEQLGADFVPLYRTRELRPPRAPEGDLVVLASASAARAFGRLGSAIPAVSIGPQTTRAAVASGVRVLSEARSHDVEGLLEAVEEAARLTAA